VPDGPLGGVRRDGGRRVPLNLVTPAAWGR
jgi:hypothetical protein